MKILRREAFLELPSGVLFAKGKPWYFETPHVKGDTIYHNGKAIDFIHRDLVSISSHDSGEWSDRLDEMVEKGVSYPINEDYGRDGCFDNDDLFLVYEDVDLVELRSAIDAALSHNHPAPENRILLLTES